jgi:hypothetical protein
MIMTKPIGGRGHRAPYQTTHLRVPLPLKSAIEAMIDDYRAVVIDGEPPAPAAVPPLEESLEMVQKLLRAKTSKTETIKKLLEFIYKEDVNGF